MSSEWLKVMLEEIARKKAEEALSRAEEERRAPVVIQSGNSAPRKEIGDAE
jgi:hypothetical protein